MLPPTEAPGILARLRAETRPYHDALEQNDFNQALTAGTLSRAGTEQFLADMYGFLQPYEVRLQSASLGPEWEVSRRLRAPLILQDLHRNPAAPGLPLCPDMPPLDTQAQLLGAMYVLEGSTLGGQVIARQLAKAGIPARTFFQGAGERTGPQWKLFCQLLTEAAPAAGPDELVQSASLTFQKLYAWLNRP
ncbi:biliverdin-producing heme oxygenase [Hymenobacter persicinus]|uniref:Biliverdin-producing heme oxygenase n=1 Tax=Hymenobacter persicinus TaxID=2025506 RepID=A0A4V1ZAM6_9BACT|nr:biliverdin-producing heme oxygenase [Hymenobacter persicinus]RYU78796.1 biliverdin-producing heme oxygenase [Hymenobacter persicinus]